MALVLFITAGAAGCAKAPLYRHPDSGSVMLERPASSEEAVEDARVDEEQIAVGEGPSIAVITFEDARSDEHKEGMTSLLEEHGGYTGEAMTGDAAYAMPLARMASEALAHALESTGRFSRVERADVGEDLDVDLVLTGRLRRLRGWQAFRAEDDEPAKVIESIGDVFVDEIEIRDVSAGEVVFLGQTGALLEEPPELLDPYEIAQKASDEALTALARQIADSELREPIAESVAMMEDARGDTFSGLFDELPPGWDGRLGEPETPVGWRGDGDCRALEMQDRSRAYYHPRLGFYVPTVQLWLCPSEWEGEMLMSGEETARFPARVIGFTSDGEALLGLSLGKSSWPSAWKDLVRYLGLTSELGQPLLRLPKAVDEEKLPPPPTPGMPLPEPEVP